MLNHRKTGLTAGVVAAMIVAGCSQQAPAEAPAPAKAAATAPAQPAPPASTAQTVGGDGSQIELSALTPEDMRAQSIPGELGCSFSTDTASPLLVAMGYVGSSDAAVGLVKVSGYVERIAAPGGFDGMLKGAVFTGQGKTIRIAVTGPATGGGESPPSPATLTYERADGASLTLDGHWTCGP